MLDAAIPSGPEQREVLEPRSRAPGQESHSLRGKTVERDPAFFWRQLCNRLMWGIAKEIAPFRLVGDGTCVAAAPSPGLFCCGDASGDAVAGSKNLSTPAPADIVRAMREEIGRLEDSDDIPSALEYARRTAEFARDRDLGGELLGACLTDLGLLQQQTGDHQRAEDSFDRAAEAFRSLGVARSHLLEGALSQRLRSLRLLRDPRVRFVEEEIAAVREARQAGSHDAAAADIPPCDQCGAPASPDDLWCHSCGRDIER